MHRGPVRRKRHYAGCSKDAGQARHRDRSGRTLLRDRGQAAPRCANARRRNRFMKLMQETRNIFSGFDPWRKAEWALAFLSLISSCFAVSVVPFLRKDMGERYFGWINLF